jgi:hypothetical protein
MKTAIPITETEKQLHHKDVQISLLKSIIAALINEGKYKIHGESVTIRQVSVPMDSPLGDHFSKNVVDYNFKECDVICNGDGDCHILVDGKKRWLEEI